MSKSIRTVVSKHYGKIRRIGMEEKTKLNTGFEDWMTAVRSVLNEFDFTDHPKTFQAYNDGYTVDEFAEEWMAFEGII